VSQPSKLCQLLAPQAPGREDGTRWKPSPRPALYLIDTSGLFRILQDKHRQAWADQLTAGIIAACPIDELEFLYSARSRADRTEKRRMLEAMFGRVPMSEGAYKRADEAQRALTETGRHRSAGPSICLSRRPPSGNVSSSSEMTRTSMSSPRSPVSQCGARHRAAPVRPGD
jgi:predicted nucleic acid-binding protein